LHDSRCRVRVALILPIDKLFRQTGWHFSDTPPAVSQGEGCVLEIVEEVGIHDLPQAETSLLANARGQGEYLDSGRIKQEQKKTTSC